MCVRTIHILYCTHKLVFCVALKCTKVQRNVKCVPLSRHYTFILHLLHDRVDGYFGIPVIVLILLERLGRHTVQYRIDTVYTILRVDVFSAIP